MSDFYQAMSVAASGLAAQRTRMGVVSNNLAHAETTRTVGGGAYRRQEVLMEPAPLDPFGATLGETLQTVHVAGIAEDQQTPMERIFDPGHPDADPNGFVEMPNVNVVSEMVDMMTTNRSYGANANAVETTRDLARRALEIGSGR